MHLLTSHMQVAAVRTPPAIGPEADHATKKWVLKPGPMNSLFPPKSMQITSTRSMFFSPSHRLTGPGVKDVGKVSVVHSGAKKFRDWQK